MAADELELDTCPNCGRDLALCSDWSHKQHIDFRICYVKMEEEAANRAYDKLFEGKFHDGTFRSWLSKPTASHRYAHRDGLNIYVLGDKPDAEPFWLDSEGFKIDGVQRYAYAPAESPEGED